VPYDPNDPAVLACPFEAYRDLRRECPVAPVEADPPYHALSRYDDVLEVLRRPQLWVNRNGHGPGYLRRPGATLAYVDAPDHTRQRRHVQRAFTPSVVARLEPEVERLAHGLVDRFVDDGHGDLHELFSYPLPVVVIARLLGVPEDLHETFKRWSDDALARLASGDPSTYRRSAEEFDEFFRAQLADRRRLAAAGGTLPGDLLSGLVEAEQEGDGGLTEAELLPTIGQLLVAGNETTTSLLNSMVVRLCERPELLAAVRDDPALDAAVVEESLRFDPPVLGLWRTNDEPVVVHGVSIPQDSKVQVLFASANRDESVFDDPDTYRLDRGEAAWRRHLAFGFGPHVCLGAPLARLEARVGLRVLLDRLPGLRLTGRPERIPTFFLWGFRHTPVAWDR
jgi:cytochrome P450